MPGPNQIPGPTAIRAPSKDLDSHHVAIGQLKEVAETGARLRGDPNQSYVKLGELVNAGVVQHVGGVVSPAKKSSGGGGGTVSVTDSIVGDGSSGTPLALSGDTATPGNTKLYGTNSSGVKGWYSQPGGGSGSLSISDGTTTVSGVTAITVLGGVVSGTSPNATITVTAAPIGPGGITTSLYFWFEADLLTGSSGSNIVQLPNSLPGFSAYTSFILNGTSTGAVLALADLNSLNTANFPGTSNGRYTIGNSTFSVSLQQSTCFYVIKILVPGLTQVLLAGTNGSYQIGTDGTGKMAITSDLVAVLATNASALPVATYFQQNITFDNTTKAYAFRTSRSADGSGTATGNISNVTSNFIGWNAPANVQDLNGNLAEFIIYNRVLSSAEITAVENYLFAKWGV